MGRACRCICKCDKNCRLPACICADCGNVSGFDGGRWKTYHMAKIKSFIVQMLKLPEHIFCGYAVSVRCILLYDLPALFSVAMCGLIKTCRLHGVKIRIFRLWVYCGKPAPDRLSRVIRIWAGSASVFLSCMDICFIADTIPWRSLESFRC